MKFDLSDRKMTGLRLFFDLAGLVDLRPDRSRILCRPGHVGIRLFGRIHVEYGRAAFARMADLVAARKFR